VSSSKSSLLRPSSAATPAGSSMRRLISPSSGSSATRVASAGELSREAGDVDRAGRPRWAPGLRCGGWRACPGRRSTPARDSAGAAGASGVLSAGCVPVPASRRWAPEGSGATIEGGGGDRRRAGVGAGGWASPAPEWCVSELEPQSPVLHEVGQTRGVIWDLLSTTLETGRGPSGGHAEEPLRVPAPNQSAQIHASQRGGAHPVSINKDTDSTAPGPSPGARYQGRGALIMGVALAALLVHGFGGAEATKLFLALVQALAVVASTRR
jgi:hypothetical protein